MPFNLKAIFLMSFLFFLQLCNFAEAQSTPEFDIREGREFVYQIIISFSQETQSESVADQNPETKNAQLTGELNLIETITVTESVEDEYARINCRFDSLTGIIKSVADGKSASLEIFSEKDHVIIYQDDSLVSEYTPQGGPNRGAADFYEKLLFIGEDIGMLVYPSGEIINVTENKNLWNLSRDLLGFPGEGFLEIVFPGNRSRWEETLEISNLGGFELQDSPEPLIIQYRTSDGRKRVEFDGELFLRQFSSEVNVAELEDELNLTLSNYQVSKSGSGSFSGNAGTLEQLEYSISQIGNIILKGKNSEEYSIRMSTDFDSRIIYQLIR